MVRNSINFCLNFFRGLIFFFFSSCFMWASAFAFVVYDPVVQATLEAKFGMEFAKQIESIAKQGEQLIKMVEQIDKLKTQIQQFEQQIDLAKQTLKELGDDGFSWKNAKDKIDKVETLLDQTQGIAYNAADVGGRFADIFPGYKEDKSGGYAKKYKLMIDATHATLKSMLSVIGGSAKSFNDDRSRLLKLQEEAQGVKGHLQALQAGMRISAEQISQLMMLRQSLMTQTNAQIAYYAEEMQKEASREQALESVIKNGAIKTVVVGDSGMEIGLPVR